MINFPVSRLVRYGCPLALALPLAGPAAGADWLFPGPGLDFYDIGGNWSTSAAPGAGDVANFLGANSGFVSWDDITTDTTSASILVDTADVTLYNVALATSLWNHTTVGDTVVRNNGVLSLGFDPGRPMSLSVGGTLRVQDGGQFNARFGSAVDANQLFVGVASGNPATATIDGAGTTIDVAAGTFLGQNGSTGTLSFINGSTGNTLVGDVNLARSSFNNSIGILNVTGGSTVSTGRIRAGEFGLTGQSGTILVNGAGSRITQTGASTFTLGAGALSTGLLTVSNSGRFVTGTGTTTINATGTLDVNSGGRFYGRNVQLDGTVNVNGGLLFSDHLQLNGGTLTTDSNSVISVNTMAGFGNNVTLNGFVTFGEPAGATTASHTVGSDQTFNVGATMVVGLNRQATVSIMVGAEVTADNLRIADSTAANGSEIDIASGGRLFVNGNVNVGSASGGQGFLTTDSFSTMGFGGTLRVFSSGTVSIASDATLKAHTVDATGGGTFSTGSASFVWVNNLIGMGNAVEFNGAFSTGIDLGNGVSNITVGSGQTFTVGDYMIVGDESGATSVEFNVDGGQLDVNNYLDVAREHDATFRVFNGGVVNITDFNGITNNYGSASSTATLLIDGPGSQWNTGDARLSRGTMTLSNGGTFRTSDFLTILADGVVNMDPGTTLGVEGHLIVDGGTLNMFTGANLDLAAGQKLIASNGAQVGNGFNYNINENRTFQIESGADYNQGFWLDVGDGSMGTLIVEGAGSTLTTGTGTSETNIWGNNGGTAIVRLRFNAMAQLDGQGLSIARGSNAATLGIVIVETGADMIVHDLAIADGTAGNGTLTVNGTGTTVTQTGDATLILGGTGTSNATLNIQNEASFTTGTGTTTINASGTLNLDIDATLRATHIDHTNGGTFNFTTGSTLSVDTFDGDLVNDSGTLAPGQSAGTTTINGGYTQLLGAALAIELGGTTQGTEFDFVDVAGSLNLDGLLNVTLIDGFDPNAGDTFDILDWGTLTGTFDTVFLASLDSSLRWDATDLYVTGELAVKLAGDYTDDGFVDGEDLDLILASWGDAVTPGDYALGDGNGDGVIGNSDLQLVLSNFGNAAPGGGSVPEPGSLALLGLGGLALLRRRL